jgi:hypothetical protein
MHTTVTLYAKVFRGIRGNMNISILRSKYKNILNSRIDSSITEPIVTYGA